MLEKHPSKRGSSKASSKRDHPVPTRLPTPQGLQLEIVHMYSGVSVGKGGKGTRQVKAWAEENLGDCVFGKINTPL